MKIGRWAWWLLAAAPLLAGCGDFWQSPNGSSSTSFSLANSGNFTVSPGATSGNTATITVTPGSSFTGTVSLTCAVTAPSGATNPATCSLSSSSLTFSSTATQTATMTATTTSTTTLGAYEFAVTGNSSGTTESTTVCVEVGSGSCSAPASTSGYFYVLDSSTYQVIAYDINAGALTEVAAYTLPYSPIAIAVAPNNNFLYVSTLDGIFLYTISSSNGALTLGSTTPITSDPALAMQVDATNSWLVEASGLGDLYAVPIVPSTGQLSSVIATCYVPLNATTVNQLAIAPNNDYVFVAGGTSGTAAFGFNAADGNAPSGPFGSAAYTTILPANTSGGGALSVAVDPSNLLLYIGEADAVSSSGGLRGFTIGTGGALTQINGSPLASGGTGPRSILPISTGGYVYVANWNGASAGNITGFAITAIGSSYTLTNLNNPVATGVEPVALVEDSTAQFALAVSQGGNPYFDAYTFDTTTAGQLDVALTSSAIAASGIAAQH